MEFRMIHIILMSEDMSRLRQLLLAIPLILIHAIISSFSEIRLPYILDNNLLYSGIHQEY